MVAGAALVSCGASDASSPAASASSASAQDAGTCPNAAQPTSPGRLSTPDIDEVSGLVASSKNEGVYWVHNDSGDAARAFAVGPTGTLLATLVFDVAAPIDMEDMAIEDGPGGSFLYFGDIGDNGSSRPELTIHRVAEPKLTTTSVTPEQLTAASETMRVHYVDGRHNAETLLFDPITNDLLIVTKQFLGTTVHRVGPFVAGAEVTTEKIASVSAVGFATGGDISRDGRLIGLRNYGTEAVVWVRAPGETLQAALAREPCRVPVAEESQGEAFGFLPKGNGYITVSEGKGQELHLTLLP
jgi:hypothetical protein